MHTFGEIGTPDKRPSAETHTGGTKEPNGLSMEPTKCQKWCGRGLVIFVIVSVLTQVAVYTYIRQKTNTDLARHISDSLTKKNTDTARKEEDYLPSPQNSSAQRHGLLREKCKVLYHGKRPREVERSRRRSHIIVNDKYKVMFCYIPKIACSNFKKVFIVLTGKLNVTDPMDILADDAHHKYRQLLSFENSFSKQEFLYRLKHYKKVIFVREPFERLLSAYRNKLFNKGKKGMKARLGREIIEQFRKNATKESLAKGHDVTFSEFVQHVIKQVSLNNALEDHWAKYSDLCEPCQVQYDFIGRYERMEDDMDDFLKDLGINTFIQFPKQRHTHTSVKTIDVMYDFYKDINREDLIKLKDIYANDSFLFGYEMPAVLSKMLHNNTNT